MSKIRRTNYIDKFRIKKMISYLDSSVVDYYTRIFRYFPFIHLHNFFPMRFKFLPESYVIEDKKNILGLIALTPAHANPYKQTISRLFLDNEDLGVGKQLIDFAISKYGAKGAELFLSVVNSSNDDLIDLFVNGCGFRQCSVKELWFVPDIKSQNESSSFIRKFHNSDAQNVAELYNSILIPHFKNSLKKCKYEYTDSLFKPMDDFIVFKYIIEDESTKNIKTFFSIMSNDDENFTLTITASPWYETLYEDVIRFAKREIKKRTKNAKLYVKIRKYTQNYEELEKYLYENGAQWIQSQAVLVKDFYREVRETNPHKILLFNQITNNTAFKVQTK